MTKQFNAARVIIGSAAIAWAYSEKKNARVARPLKNATVLEANLVARPMWGAPQTSNNDVQNPNNCNLAVLETRVS